MAVKHSIPSLPAWALQVQTDIRGYGASLCTMRCSGAELKRCCLAPTCTAVLVGAAARAGQEEASSVHMEHTYCAGLASSAGAGAAGPGAAAQGSSSGGREDAAGSTDSASSGSGSDGAAGSTVNTGQPAHPLPPLVKYRMPGPDVEDGAGADASTSAGACGPVSATEAEASCGAPSGQCVPCV